MTVDDVNVGDVIWVPVTIGCYPGAKHLKQLQRLVRAQLGQNQVVYLGEEELRHAKKFDTETKES